MKRQPRGQAIVETVLGMMVMLGILVVAIHFSEIGFLSLKVEESASAAMWGSTVGKFHRWPKNDPDPWDVVPSPSIAATADAQARYADFNGVTGGGSLANQDMTTGSNVTVNCQMGLAPQNGNGVLDSMANDDMIAPNVNDNRGLSCTSQATVNASAYFPSWMFEAGSGGFFNINIRTAAATNKTICAVGRATGGACSGRFTTMVDEWGGANDDESGMCLILHNPLTAVGCSMPWANRNTRFHEASKRIYDTASAAVGAVGPLGSLGSAMAFGIVGWSPISGLWPGQDEGNFFLSDSGEEYIVPFANPVIPIAYKWPPSFLIPDYHYRPEGFGTTPGAIAPISFMVDYNTSYWARHGCFMGQNCN